MDGILSFAAVAAVVIATPGPDTALTIRNTLLHGQGGGVATALGVAAGQGMWTLAASAGVAALLVASEPAFVAVKIFGAAYLAYLGLSALRDAWTGGGAPHPVTSAGGASGRPAAFRQGLVSNLGNPKMAVFFTSLLPQFASGADAGFAELAALGALFCSLTLLWLSAYAVAVHRAGGFLRRPRVHRTLNAVTGAALIAVGLRLALERR